MSGFLDSHTASLQGYYTNKQNDSQYSLTIRFGYLICVIPPFLKKIGSWDIPTLLFSGYPKCDKRWPLCIRGMGYPKYDKGWIIGKCREGATLCHHGFTKHNSPLWVNY